MREVFTHRDYTRVGLYQSILESEGIASFIKNDTSHNLVVWLPVPFLHPVLCVASDADFERAVEILRTMHKTETADEPDRVCTACGGSIPGNFCACWKCGAEI